MTERAGVEWVETTELVIIQECIPPEANNPVDTVTSVIPILEPAEAPIQKLLDTVVPGESTGFCCEECLSLFQDENDPNNISGPSFVLDFPTAVDVPQRALLTLPFGLMIGRSSIPNAGIGVVNHGPTLSPGMHFGPYEGEMVAKEDALLSNFSWEINKGEEGYEFIDGAKETHANWMRYVNSSRNKEEANLLAVQYKGSILFHCCRTIQAGDELMVWPSSKMLNHFSEEWTQFWFAKLNPRETNTAASTQILLCSHCQLSFTTESYLQRHIEYFHTETSERVEIIELPSSVGDAVLDETQAEASEEPKICSDCGKSFKQMAHLKRHKLCVHAKERPFCCTHCKRSFSQASGLIRHQLIHKKPSLMSQKDFEADDNPISESPNSDEHEEGIINQNSEEVMAETETENQNSTEVEPEPAAEPEELKKCPDCDKMFTLESNLKKHVMLVHANIRPYVCSFCQKGFRQHSDLARHLKWHKKQRQKMEQNTITEDTIVLFSCPVCMVNEASVEDLKEHIKAHHPEVVFVESQNDDPVVDGGINMESPPPPQPEETNSPPPISTNQRPQRLGARSKVAALTKLIAPKHRKVQSSTTSSVKPTSSEENVPDPETPSSNSAKTRKFKWYSCNRCKRTYANPKLLKTHRCPSRQHKCAQCGAVFSKSGFLARHERLAHGDPRPKSTCSVCGKVFSTTSKLKHHQKNKNCDKYLCKSEVFPCPFCQFSFSIKNYLLKHIRRHHPVEYLSHWEAETLEDLGVEEEEKEKLYKCSLCDKTYASANTFKKHACMHAKILYLCPDCGKGFSNKYGLKQHQRVHTGEKPHSCPHCPKSFAHVGQLNVHLRTHTGEKPYLCTHCGDSFRQSGDLKRHERKHTGVRPHTCPECGKSFSRPQSLKAHLMLHMGQRMFKCTQCGKSFSRNYHLRRHHQKMHL